ncbi:hypothetical protein KI387_005107, partial [Taxus chinensis]
VDARYSPWTASYQVFGDGSCASDISQAASIGYGDKYHAHRHETRLALLMMIGDHLLHPPGLRGRLPSTGINGGAS